MNFEAALIWTHALYVVVCIVGIIEIVKTKRKLKAIKKRIGGE